MNYSTPELVELGSATALVLGVPGGPDDNINPDFEMPAEGVVADLDE